MIRAKLDPHQFVRRIPLAPHQMQDRITPVKDAIVLCHLGVPRLPREHWTLTIDGLVARPRTLSFDDLARYDKKSVTSVHQCAGSPLQPFEPTQRVCNVTWTGASLADILADCGPSANAQFVWSTGADYGRFGDVSVDAYVKDMPIERMKSDVLVAYEMNGEPLTSEHGFPARLVVPGFYGTNSVKWLTRVTLSQERAHGPFTTRWYNDPVQDERDGTDGRVVPVWAIAPQSVIVAPAPEATLSVTKGVEVWGWAWADGGVRLLDVRIDHGEWEPAEVEATTGRSWQRFSLSWVPAVRGRATLASRAISASGECQPLAGRRNAICSVTVNVA